ncbi:Bestrophin, RFP-TM, chloride channel-domain-containing protein [Gongronella butleri]|nr:Bestrophin, RFP-TM, chloride channel-domain-containing protein [Gongronella butleri]
MVVSHESDTPPDYHRQRWLRELCEYPDQLRLRGSVVPDIFPLVILTTVYAYAIAHAYENGYENIAISNSVIPALSVVLGLLLAFRANTSYARYYEGRQLWETLQSNARNLARLVWLSIPERSQTDHLEKMRCMKLILAFAVATKHQLRHEFGVDYYDLDYLLPPHWIPAATADDNAKARSASHHLAEAFFNVDKDNKRRRKSMHGDRVTDEVNRRLTTTPPDASASSSTASSTSAAELAVGTSSNEGLPAPVTHKHHHLRRSSSSSSSTSSTESSVKDAGETSHPHVNFVSEEDLPDEAMQANMSLPLEILFRMSLYMAQAQNVKKIDGIFSSTIISHLNALNDCLAGLERLQDTPIPKAYNIHLKQSLWLYLLVMPFTIVSELGWWLVPTVVITSFILYGIDSIGAQIEECFGYEGNCLPLNQFCDSIRKEIEFIVHHVPCELVI